MSKGRLRPSPNGEFTATHHGVANRRVKTFNTFEDAEAWAKYRVLSYQGHAEIHRGTTQLATIKRVAFKRTRWRVTTLLTTPGSLLA